MYRSLAAVFVSACLTIVLIDRLLAHISPVVHRREVQEGMADLEELDPEILVLGSSHGRTFHVLGQELVRQSNGSHTLVSIPLENGKLTAYEWLLDNRVSPLLEQSQRKRAALKRLIILTEWWDSCRDKSAGWNLPSRAWTLGTYVSDVLKNGMNNYNRNFVQSKWRRLFWDSPLVQDRGFETLPRNVIANLRHRSTKLTDDAYQQKVIGWQKLVEGGTSCLGNPTEMAALRHLVEFGVTNHLDTTVVLFPRKPDTLTEKSKSTTLRIFRDEVKELVEPMGARVVDLTWSSPLRSEDFMDDFDHVNREGNEKFAKWALSGPLAFLLESTVASDQRSTK